MFVLYLRLGSRFQTAQTPDLPDPEAAGIRIPRRSSHFLRHFLSALIGTGLLQDWHWCVSSPCCILRLVSTAADPVGESLQAV